MRLYTWTQKEITYTVDQVASKRMLENQSIFDWLVIAKISYTKSVAWESQLFKSDIDWERGYTVRSIW